MADDLVIKFEERMLRLHIRKSKIDQRGAGTWRTLECCGKGTCLKTCPFELAIAALNDLKAKQGNSPLFLDWRGRHVSKLHSIKFLALFRYIEEAMTELPMNANMAKQVEKAPRIKRS